MRLDKVLYFITEGTTKTANGFPVQAESSRRQVFAKKKSIRQSEHYQSKAANVKVDLMFEVYKFEYQGEATLEYESELYEIERTFDREDGFTELSCKRIKEAGEPG